MSSLSIIITETYTAPRAVRLSELASALKEVLEDNFGGTHLITAEIASLSAQNARGHCYMELVDRNPLTGEESRMRATCWATRWRVVSHYFEQEAGQKLAKGMQVLIEGQLAYHPTYGLSLNIVGVDAGYTLGRQKQEMERILLRLQEEGLMELQKQLEPKPVLQRIAVISSPSAAGYQDFVEQLKGNPYDYSFELTLFTAVMQGPDTEASILNALQAIRLRMADFDCVAILRGGGADQDLVAFNSYALGKSLAEFGLPILTGIGHERDTTVPDLVAYNRSKTPTALAEYLIELASSYEGELNEAADAITATLNTWLLTQQNRLARLESGLVGNAAGALPAQATRLTSLCERTGAAARRWLDGQSHVLDMRTQQTRLLDPGVQLKRGFALIYNEKGIVRSPAGLKGPMRIVLAEGEAKGEFR